MAFGSAMTALQAAIYSKLASDSALRTFVNLVRDASAVPERQAFPYLTIQMLKERQTDTLNCRGYECFCRLQIWTQTPGFKVAQNILARTNLLLHRQPLSLNMLTHIGTWYQDAESKIFQDGLTLNITAHYRLLVQEAFQ